MFLRQLSELSSKLKGLAPLCNHAFRFYGTSSMEAPREHDSMDCRDQLSSSLDSPTADQIISTLEAKKDLIKGSHIVSALDNLLKQLTHFHGTEQKADFIGKFISILGRNRNKLSGHQLADVIQMLEQLGVQKSSKIHSAMLQLVLHKVDDLSLKKLCELSNVISDDAIDCSLKRDLHTALVTTFLKKLSKDFGQHDLEIYQYALQFISQIQELPNKYHLIQRIMKKLCNWDDIIPFQSALKIHESLHSIKQWSHLKANTLHKVERDLAKQIHSLNHSQVKEIICEMQRLKLTDDLYHDEKLLNALTRRVIDEKLEPILAILMLTRFYKSRYTSPELIQYCCSTVFCQSTKQITAEQKMQYIQSLLPVLSATRCKTVFWDEIQDFVSKYVRDLCGDSETLVYMASQLIALGWLNNPLVEKIFDGSFRPSTLNFTSSLFCNIYQRLKLDPSYNGPYPTDSQVADLKLVMQKRHCVRKFKRFPLLIYLKEGIKNPACIQINIKTRLFRELDYVVAFYEDGTPAPIDRKQSTEKDLDDIIYIEDLTVPQNAKLVIIQQMWNRWFFRNTNEIMGHYQAMTVEVIEFLPYPAVFIKIVDFHRLPESRRTPFLMEAIRAKLNSHHSVGEI